MRYLTLWSHLLMLALILGVGSTAFGQQCALGLAGPRDLEVKARQCLRFHRLEYLHITATADCGMVIAGEVQSQAQWDNAYQCARHPWVTYVHADQLQISVAPEVGPSSRTPPSVQTPPSPAVQTPPSRMRAGTYEEADTALQQGDYARARILLQPLAEQGNAIAQNSLGYLYAHGLGVVQQDYMEARKWYRRAADPGNAFAQYNLGLLYRKGRGGPPNDKAAVQWYRRAAAQGMAFALLNLGYHYSQGLGTPQDYVQAHVCYNLAAAHLAEPERETAAHNRDSVARKMTPEQLARAQEVARTWQPRPERPTPPSEPPPGGSALPSPTPGASHRDLIHQAQERLQAEGFNPGKPDGVLGPQTRDALLAYQTKNGLPRTGDLNPATLDALRIR